MDFIDRLQPVFLVGTPKSGTTFLWSLFDSHPSVLPLLEARAYHAKLDRGAEDESSVSAAEHYFEPILGRIHPQLDTRRFLVCLERHLRIEKGRIAKCIMAAMVDALEQSLDAGYLGGVSHLVDKTPQHFEHVSAMLRDFPDAKFVHVLRDPRDNYLALKRRMTARGGGKANRDGYHPIIFLGNRLMASLESAHRNVALYPDRYRVLFYEDLIDEPERVMRQLAEWIGLPWRASLLQPSRFGTPWGGNSVAPDLRGRLRPFDRRPIGRWKRELSEREVRVAEEIIRRAGLEDRYPLTRRTARWRFAIDIALPFEGEVRRELRRLVRGSGTLPRRVVRVVRDYLVRRMRVFSKYGNGSRLADQPRARSSADTAHLVPRRLARQLDRPS